MNLHDSKEPQKSGNSESREFKPKLIIYTIHKSNHLLDSFNYYMDCIKTDTVNKRKFLDDCGYIDQELINEITKGRK